MTPLRVIIIIWRSFLLNRIKTIPCNPQFLVEHFLFFVFIIILCRTFSITLACATLLIKRFLYSEQEYSSKFMFRNSLWQKVVFIRGYRLTHCCSCKVCLPFHKYGQHCFGINFFFQVEMNNFILFIVLIMQFINMNIFWTFICMQMCNSMEKILINVLSIIQFWFAFIVFNFLLKLLSMQITYTISNTMKMKK